MSHIYTHQLEAATSQHNEQLFSLSTKYVLHKYCMTYLMYPCTVYQNISLSHNMPHYSPTIRVCVRETCTRALRIYCRLHNIKFQMPMPLTKNFPGTVKRSKGELNVQSKCHENEHSSPSSKSSVGGKKTCSLIQMPVSL
jgi:hypothetical protein